MQAVGDHDVGIRRVGAEPVDDRVWLDRQRALFPGLAAVARALDRAALSRNEIAVAHEDGLRIARLERDAAAIGDTVALGKTGKPVQRPGRAVVEAAP